MPVVASFSGPHEPERVESVREALGAIAAPAGALWAVVVAMGDPEDPEIVLTVLGPDCHRRVFRIFGRAEGRHEPGYLAALVRAEIHAFPSVALNDYPLAVAELYRLGIPYDESTAFSGYVLVENTPVSIRHLVDLYASRQLTRDAIHRSGCDVTDAPPSF
jgi:hypothetical protein